MNYLKSINMEVRLEISLYFDFPTFLLRYRLPLDTAKMVNISVKRWQMVQPAAPTPRRDVWISNVDLVVGRNHAKSVYFYKPNGTGSSHFFSMDVLKDALSKVLVPFYPIAGRLKKDTHEQGRIQINCNDEGVLLIEAVTDSAISDFGDFAPTVELNRLVPQVDSSSEDVSSYPLLLLQVTFFKCGGVSLGVGIHHTVVDGYTGLHFINSWSEVARGIDISQPPYLDRSLLQANNTPTPKFHHIEYQPSPSLRSKITENDCSVRIFKITKGELDSLKGKATQKESGVKYSTYEVLSGHIWRCCCKARNLSEDQETKMYFPVDSRVRLHPPLPPGYFGNAIFMATAIGLVGDIISKPLYHVARLIHEVSVRMDNEYLRSALDYLELQPYLGALTRGAHTIMCPNIGITSWSRLPIHDADFGWGRPIFMGPGVIVHEGKAYVLPGPTNDGSFSIVIRLQAEHMVSFENFLYELY